MLMKTDKNPRVEELRAPEGMFRVRSIDPILSKSYFVEDYHSRREAFDVADDHNKKRKSSVDDIYRVFDDQGKFACRSDGEVPSGPRISR